MITTDSFGNTYWNKFIKQLSAQNYCYTNNQITSDWTNIASFFENIFTTRFTAGATAALPSGFTLDSVFEEKTTSTGTDYTGNRFIIKGSGESSGVGISSDAQLISPSVSIAANNIFNDTSTTKSTIISARADCVVGFIFDNISPASLDCKGLIAFGWLVDALYPDDNITGYGNAFFIIGDGTNIEAFHIDQKNGNVKKAILTSGAANFTFQSVTAGITIPTDAVTNLVLVDSATSQMLGSVPTNLLLGKGGITLGQLYALPYLGQGMSNTPQNTDYSNFLAATNWGTGKLLTRIASSGMGGDPYFSNVVLYLRGDGANNSTTIVDSSPIPKSITRFGTVQISTAQSKYGGSSILFSQSTSNYLTLAASSDWQFSGDFTIEGWFYWNGVETNGGCVFFATGVAGSLDQLGSYGEILGGYGKLDWGSIGVITNQWTHLAICRSGSSIRAFKNGTQVGLTVTNSNTLGQNLTLFIGKRSDNQHPYGGYIDSLRITKGIARYTANFNPETDTFMN